MLHHSLVDGKSRSHVLHNRTHIHGDGRRRRYLTLNDSIHELLLTTLRITLLQGHNFNSILRTAKLLSALLREQFDGGHLIGLDTDIACGDLRTHHQQFKTHENLIGMFHHQTEVGGDIGFAFYGIDDHTLSLGRGRGREFDECRETGTTHTHDTSVLDTCDDLLRREFRMRLNGLQLVGAVDALFPLVTLDIDDDHGLTITGGIDGSINLEDRTANG